MRIEKRKRKNQELSGERREKKKKKKQYTLNKINKSTLPFLLLFTLHVYIYIVYLLLFHRCIFNHIGIKWIQLTINKCTTYYSNPSG